MRTLIAIAVVALVAGGAIALIAKPRLLDERLLELEVSAVVPEVADTLAGESAELQRLVLSYADEPVLLLKTEAALIRYPELAREVLPLYGDTAEFRSALAEYGEQVLVPVAYFRSNEVGTVAAIHRAGHGWRSALYASREYLSAGSGGVPPAPYEPLSAVDRGWYAVNFVAAEGYNFLGQFSVDGSGQPVWIQSERFAEAFTSFFVSGIRELETTVREDESVTASQVAWAAVDVAIVVGVAKLARAGKGAAVASRSAAGARSVGVTAQRLGVPRLVAYGAIAYVVVRHPGLVTDTLALIAELRGLPEWLVVGGGWALLLFPVLLALSWMLTLFLRLFAVLRPRRAPSA